MLYFLKISCMVSHIKCNILQEIPMSRIIYRSQFLTVNEDLVAWDRGRQRGRWFRPYRQINHRKSLKVRKNFSAKWNLFWVPFSPTHSIKVSSFLFCLVWFILIFICLYIKNSQVANDSLHICFKSSHRVLRLLYHLLSWSNIIVLLL